MSAREVVVVETGTANLASVMAALSRAGAAPRLARDAAEVAEAERVVLPGVGTFAAALAPLRTRALAGALALRARAGRPLLAICLGLQLLAEASEESPGVPGLSVIPGSVRRFAGPVRVPQLGWNRVVPDQGCRLLREGDAYFANSYRLVEPPSGWGVATSDHGGEFVAALERGPVLACQFHPELSGTWGRALIARWLDATEGARPC